jgi:ribonuclease HII
MTDDLLQDGYQAYLDALQSEKYSHIVGADECGFGSWAGPLVVCAVAVPISWKPIAGLNDSKKLRPAKREELYYFLRDRIAHVCTQAEASEIDRDGVGYALRRCFTDSVKAMLDRFPKALVVLDGEVRLPGIDHLHFPKADGLVPAVMAASVIGKVTHDHQMAALAAKYPGYGFGKHAGYGTPEHKAAIAAKGLTPEHRRSYNFEGSGKGEPISEETGMAIDDGTYKGGLQHQCNWPDMGGDR